MAKGGKHNFVLPSKTGPNQKFWWGKHPTFVQIRYFLREMVENAPKFCTFGCYWKYQLKQLIIFWLTNPTIDSEIPLEGNTTIFFYGLRQRNQDTLQY